MTWARKGCTELGMAKDTKAVEIPAHLCPVLQAAAKNLLAHLYGPEGPPWSAFAELEGLAVRLGSPRPATSPATQPPHRHRERRMARTRPLLLPLPPGPQEAFFQQRQVNATGQRRDRRAG
jgi:hypothetical protein